MEARQVCRGNMDVVRIDRLVEKGIIYTLKSMCVLRGQAKVCESEADMFSLVEIADIGGVCKRGRYAGKM